MNGIAQYMSFILHFVVCTSLLCGVLVWMQRSGNRKPRISLSVCFILISTIMVFRLVLAYLHGIPAEYPVLPVVNLYGGLLCLLLLYLYPIEVVNPGWFSPGRALLLFMPLIVSAVILFVVRFEFRELDSILQVWRYIGEPNVWFRILILLVCIIPYSVLLLFVPYNWKRSSVNSRWILSYTVGVQGIGLLYVVLMFTGSILVSALHLTYSLLFVMWVTYQELWLRLIPKSTDNKVKAQPAQVMSEKSTSMLESVDLHPLWRKLTILMDEEELWREPDLTLEHLANRLSTNRTTLSALIQHQGYAGYTDFINRRRIEAFTEAVESSRFVNTQQLFYDVGFRSKSTALRNFRLYVGCTPGEYIQKIGQQTEG